MKSFDAKLQNQGKWIWLIFFLVIASILANMSQAITVSRTKFHFGEMILIMLNDSYTGFYAFPFLFGFLISGLFQQDTNIYYQIIRYRNKKQLFNETMWNLLRITFMFLGAIILFSFLAGCGNSGWGVALSDAFNTYTEAYLGGIPKAKCVGINVVETVFMHVLLFLFYALFQYILIQTFSVKTISFLIYNVSIFLFGAMSLGYFGTSGEKISVNSIAGLVYKGRANLCERMLLLLVLDLIMYFMNRYIFVNKDISLPKGNKQYQEE